MVESLPRNAQKYTELLPEDRTDPATLAKIEKFKDLYGDTYVRSILWTQLDAKKALTDLGIKNSSAFYSFYLNSFELPDCFRGEQLYGLSEILDSHRNPFWSDLEGRFLQMSSIEGEYSYFYDKITDEFFGVDWSDMGEFMAGRVKPLFSSFYDFLDWYFSDQNED